MRKLICILFFILFFASSCATLPAQEKSAEAILHETMEAFSITDGYVYGKCEGETHFLSDAMLERMFMGADLADLCYVESMAVYFSRRFSEREILVIELFDMSHREAIVALLEKRANRKENALVSTNGRYVYLVCTENNEEILSFLREKG